MSDGPPTCTPPKAPPGLGSRGRRLWRTTVEAFELSEGEQVLLCEACRVLDACEQLAKELRAAPMVVAGSRGQDVAHPLRAELRAERLLLSKLLSQLGIELAEEGAWDNMTAAQRARRAARARWDKRGSKR